MRKLALFAVALVLITTAFRSCMTNEQNISFDMVNNSRAAHGLPPLEYNFYAHKKAQNYANYLAQNQMLVHSRSTAGLEEINWSIVGENIGRGYNLEGIHQAFMSSPTHKANILDPNYDWLGVGIAKNGDIFYVVHTFVGDRDR